MMEWECCLECPEDGAREGAEFIASHIVRATERAFDDFAAGAPDASRLRRMLGLPAERMFGLPAEMAAIRRGSPE